MLWLLLTLILAALLGSVVKSQTESKKDSKWDYIWSSLAAVGMVPLFLNLLSSELIKSALDANSPDVGRSLLVILGFALVAAIYSSRFIEAVSGNVINQLKDKVEKNEKEVDNLKNELSEPEEPTKLTQELTADPDPKALVLKVLSGGRWAYRSAKGVAIDVGVPLQEAQRLLMELEADNVVKRSKTARGERWSIKLGIRDN